MPEEVLQALSGVLAVIGGVALAVRLVRSAARVVLQAAEITMATSGAEISARRGDLTALAERQEDEREARRGRRRDLAAVLLWFLWLVAPPVAGWVPLGYVLAAPLWLLPSASLRVARSRE